MPDPDAQQFAPAVWVDAGTIGGICACKRRGRPLALAWHIRRGRLQVVLLGQIARPRRLSRSR
ncbi:MAG: hypothetical protein ACRDHX_16790 [Chloroflexota bacterium]